MYLYYVLGIWVNIIQIKFRKANVKLFYPYFLFFEKMTGFVYIYIYTDFGVFILNEMN